MTLRRQGLRTVIFQKHFPQKILIIYFKKNDYDTSDTRDAVAIDLEYNININIMNHHQNSRLILKLQMFLLQK